MRTASPISAVQDHIHAVCNKIGERLPHGLRIEPNLPARPQDLLARMSELGCEASFFFQHNELRESPVILGGRHSRRASE